MNLLTTPILAQVCHIFMDVAYPDGADTMPANRRVYYEMGADRELTDYVLPAEAAQGICQELPRRAGAFHGYAFRLGSASYRHLKLRVQRVPHRDQHVWVYSVDTHDGAMAVTKDTTPEGAEKWRQMVEQNRVLKHDIEAALSLAGFLTPKDLLQLDLPAPA